MSTPESSVGSISIEPAGATIKPSYTTRTVKTMALTASELSLVSSLNTRATIYISVASSLLSLAFGIWITAAFTADNAMTPEGKVLAHYGAPLTALLGIVFGVLAIFEFKHRNSALNDIRGEQQAAA